MRVDRLLVWGNLRQSFQYGQSARLAGNWAARFDPGPGVGSGSRVVHWVGIGEVESLRNRMNASSIADLELFDQDSCEPRDEIRRLTAQRPAPLNVPISLPLAEEIHDFLSELGITEFMLFPDLDGLATDLRVKYGIQF